MRPTSFIVSSQRLICESVDREDLDGAKVSPEEAPCQGDHLTNPIFLLHTLLQ